MIELFKDTDKELTRKLTYAGFVLVAFELVKSMIIKPIKVFYQDTTFGEGLPFHSYEQDVKSRHKNEFEACLLYLRDFMEAINSKDFLTIQGLRKHRNDIAHDLPDMISKLDISNYLSLMENTDNVIFKLSKYRTYIEIGADPKIQSMDINWDTLKGHEYLLFEEILKKVKLLGENRNNA